jgi:glycosyltransferase involved in cell wall biosynthesis
MTKEFNPKVSIVIPVYNGSNYVKEAIDSALAQTYKNIEIIVVNDGSRDDGKTDKICRSYGDKIRYFSKENGGAATALNMGVEEMEGEYFSWLSHDDVYYPDKVEKQVRFLSKIEDKRNIILYADFDTIDSKSRPLDKVRFDHKELTEKPEYALLRGCINGISMLIPKKAFKEHGGFDGQYRCTQDYELWRKFAKTYKFVHMKDIFTKTRIHEMQDSNNHPNVLTEGNPLWIGMMQDVSKKRREELEGTEYNFFREMRDFLKTTPYREAEDSAKAEMEKIYNSEKKNIEKIKVTIVIPFYNRISLLLKSIGSVTIQTHKNLEILLINDCSTEDLSIVNSVVQSDSRIKLHSLLKNGGPAVARNKGIEKASGEYIAFLDSDDEFLRDKVESQLTEMFLTGYDVSHTSYISRMANRDQAVEVGFLTGDVIPEIIGSCQIATPTIMVKTEYLKKNGFRFREDIRIGEDICFWLTILRNKKLLGINKFLTIVNVSEKSSINDLKKQIEGFTNIISFVLNDKDYSKYHSEIATLCYAYYKASRGLVPVCEDTITHDYSFWRNKPSNPILKMIFLFKNQGVIVTLKKVLRKCMRKVFR